MRPGPGPVPTPDQCRQLETPAPTDRRQPECPGARVLGAASEAAGMAVSQGVRPKRWHRPCESIRSALVEFPVPLRVWPEGV